MDTMVVYIIELPALAPIIGMCLAPLVEPVFQIAPAL
jgi:hypothetical protein